MDFVSLNHHQRNTTKMRLHSTTGFSLLPWILSTHRSTRSSVNIAFECFTQASIRMYDCDDRDVEYDGTNWVKLPMEGKIPRLYINSWRDANG